ncbi:hypothetical protein ACQ9A1_25360, partial [Escherichia coli]
DRNRSHWSTSKTPSYTKSVSWQHHPDRLPLLMATVLKKRIRLQGFIIAQDYGHRIHEFQREMGQWVKEDKIHYREEITDGLENAPQTFIGLLKGKNFGKVVIRVAGDD